MSEPAEGEFDLNSLNDEELTEQVHDDLYNGLKPEVEQATRIFLKRGWSAEKVLNDALVEGMRIVGIDFRDGILFVPEVLLAANSMKGGMEILRPLLAETGVEPIGKIVIGTVKGDIHDIGKNLVSMMLEGAGFEVVDLGINNPVDKYLAALEQHKPDILGMSALLTTTMRHPQRLHRVGRRRAAQRGIRQGGRRRRLLPRRRRRGRDSQGFVGREARQCRGGALSRAGV
jgi:methanogenic corrinoid protein MtbC1